MKKNRRLLLVLLALSVLIGLNGQLFADIFGQGNAQWGMNRNQILNLYSTKFNSNKARLLQNRPALIKIQYLGGNVLQKQYEFQRNSLVKITLQYSIGSNVIVGEYNRKYKNRTNIQNGILYWIFKSTVITHRRGSSITIFWNRNFLASQNQGQTATNKLAQVKIGMPTGQVERIMGQPLSKVAQGKGRIVYTYQNAVIILLNGKVIEVRRTK